MSLDRLRVVDPMGVHPVHVVVAGKTAEDVEKLKGLVGTPSYIIHVVDVPVAPTGVLDPPVLVSGMEGLVNFPEFVAVSWLLVLSPEITVERETLATLENEGLAGALKQALADYLARLLDGTALKPSDLNTMIDIVVLVLRNA